MKTNLVETLVGAVVILIAAAFFTFAYTTSGIGKGSGGYQLSAEFDNAEGIGVGSDVRMSGVKIGTITRQELDPTTYQAVLSMSIDPELKLPDDTSAKVTSEGLLGSKFVALEPGGSPDMLEDGDRIIYTQGAIDIWSLVSQFMFDNDSSAPAPDSGDSSAPAPDSGAVPE